MDSLVSVKVGQQIRLSMQSLWSFSVANRKKVSDRIVLFYSTCTSNRYATQHSAQRTGSQDHLQLLLGFLHVLRLFPRLFTEPRSVFCEK